MSKINVKFQIDESTITKITGLVMNLYDIFISYDAITVEINPLGLTTNDDLVALDAVIEIDDDALYRHKEFCIRSKTSKSSLEAMAERLGFIYIELDGNLGVRLYLVLTGI